MDNLVLCTIIEEPEIKQKSKKLRLASDAVFKKPTEASMMCMVDKEMFFLFMKNTQIRNSSASCHITNNDTGLFDVTFINKVVQGRLDSISATKKVNCI